jgi:hypothetical protein
MLRKRLDEEKMEELYKKIKLFLSAHFQFYGLYNKTQCANVSKLQAFQKSLSDDEFALLSLDASKMQIFFSDPEVRAFVLDLRENIFNPIKNFRKTIDTARGKLPEKAKSALQKFEIKTNEDLSLERIKEFENRVLEQLQKDNKKILPQVMQSHIDQLVQFERVLHLEEERRKITDVHVSIINYCEIFENYLRQTKPLLLATIEKLKQAKLQRVELTPNFPKDFKPHLFFYNLVRREMDADWPVVPAQAMQTSLVAMQTSLSKLMDEIVVPQYRSDNRDTYRPLASLDKEFNPTYHAYWECLPTLSPLFKCVNTQEKCKDTVLSWVQETDIAMLSHEKVQTARSTAGKYFRQRLSGYMQSLQALDKNLQETQERYEAWVQDIDMLLDVRLPRVKATTFNRLAVDLKFQHIRQCAATLEDPEGDLKHVNRELCKKILNTFLYTGRSRRLFVSLQTHAASNPIKRAKIEAFIRAFTDEDLTKNLADIVKIFTDVEADDELMTYTAKIGGRPIARVSTTKDLVRNLHLELEKIIEKENLTHAIQKSVEATIQEDEALLFDDKRVVFNFDKVFDEFMTTFKDAFSKHAEMIKLREEMVNIYCWPLSEESKFMRMYLALTHASIHMQTGKIKLDNEAKGIAVFANKHYPAKDIKKGEFTFTYACQALRSRLSTVATHRIATLLLLFKSLDRIALLDDLDDKQKLTLLQQVVGNFDKDIRNSTNGSPGWLYRRNGSKLANEIEAFMREEWALDVPQFLLKLSGRPQDPHVSSNSL